jgi:hypothetical protein
MLFAPLDDATESRPEAPMFVFATLSAVAVVVTTVLPVPLH